MNPESELRLLREIEELDGYNGVVKLVLSDGLSLCQVLGEVESLAEESLDYVIQDDKNYSERLRSSNCSRESSLNEPL